MYPHVYTCNMLPSGGLVEGLNIAHVDHHYLHEVEAYGMKAATLSLSLSLYIYIYMHIEVWGL